MRIRKQLLPGLLGCAVLTLAVRHSTRRAALRDDDNAYEAMDATLERVLRQLNVPGAALAVVEGDRPVHFHGFGRARPSGEPPAPETPFVIGSLTKSFTAVAAMQLAEAGKIELDAPVQRYLPWFRVADPQASPQITIRHLLNQTGGLPQLPGMRNLANFDARPDAAERQMRALATLELNRPVGAAFEYSNLNYNLLGLIVEAASGETYADYVRRHIFKPLEMSHSHTSQATARRDGLAVGHRFWFGFPVAAPDLPLPQASLPSGQLMASAGDMARYLSAHLNQGRAGDARILSAAGMEELHRPVAEATAMGTSLGHYAMGWMVEEHDGTTILTHTGTTPDFFAFMALVPEQKKGLVLLINANHVVLDKLSLSWIGADLVRQLAGQPPPPSRPPVVFWLLRSLLLVPLLQIAGVVLTLRRVRRWRRVPQSRPTGTRLWIGHVLLPLVPNAALAGGAAALLTGGLFRFTSLFLPDVAWLTLFAGGFAAAWSAIRSWLVLGAARQPAD